MQYADASSSVIKTLEGRFVPVAPGNRDYEAILASGVAIDPYVHPPVTVSDVKAECQRRIIALTGTADVIGCIIKQSNANMRANELNDKRIAGEVLTAGEEAEATALHNLAVAIKALRAKSNEIEALDPIPLDFTADARWA